MKDLRDLILFFAAPLQPDLMSSSQALHKPAHMFLSVFCRIPENKATLSLPNPNIRKNPPLKENFLPQSTNSI